MIRNKSFPNWIKLGRSNNIHRRIKETNTFVPMPFILHRAWVTNDEVYAEKLCQDALGSIRAKSDAEYFSVPTSIIHSNVSCEDIGGRI